MKKNIVLVILSMIIVGLCGYLAYDKMLNKEELKENSQSQNEANIDDETNETDKKQEDKYKKYEVMENIELKDGSKWIVIKNSDENSDYVTAIARDTYEEDIQGETYEKISNEVFKSEKINYNQSEMKKYVDSIEEKLNVKLKKVDGYTIRLLQLEDLFAIDNHFQYQEDFDNYQYTGKLDLSNFLGLTMDTTKCKEGKCQAFYNLSCGPCVANQEGYANANPRYFVDHWSLGLMPIRPVIHVYKFEIK